MKWAGMYFFGFVILVGGVMAALWKLGILARIGTAWTLIGSRDRGWPRDHDCRRQQRHQGKHSDRPEVRIKRRGFQWLRPCRTNVRQANVTFIATET